MDTRIFLRKKNVLFEGVMENLQCGSDDDGWCNDRKYSDDEWGRRISISRGEKRDNKCEEMSLKRKNWRLCI